MTKRGRRKNEPNDPIQDLVDWQNHRYDPGFWVSEWYKKGRMDPQILMWKRAKLSSFWRALLIYPFIGTCLTAPIIICCDENPVPYWRMIVITANVLIFFAIWFLFSKWMNKADKRDQEGQRKIKKEKR
jgi:hypothetical protein